MLALAAALSITGASFTAAAFSDVEVSEENRFVAGELDLQLGWNESVNGDSEENQELTDDPGPVFDISSIGPGDTGEATISFRGTTNPYWLNLTVNQTSGPEPEPGYYQVDFVEGGPLENLSADNKYGSRKIEWVHSGSEDSSFWVNGTGSGCVESWNMYLDNEDHHVALKFTLGDCEKRLTLAVHEKISGGGWKPGEAEQQVLQDSVTRSFGQGTHSVEAELPGQDHGLGDRLKFSIWHDDGDNRYEEGERVIANGTAHEIGEELADGRKLSSGGSGLSAFGSSLNHIGFRWRMEEWHACEVQEQEKLFDIGFGAVQERNNPGMEMLGFSDREESLENRFATGSFAECTSCDGVEFPDLETGDKVTLEKNRDGSQSGSTEYDLEIRGGSVKYEQSGGDPLGEGGVKESQSFEVRVEDGATPVLFRIKDGGGPEIEESRLSGEGDSVEVIDGNFNVTLKSVRQNQDGSETYEIEIVSTPGEGSSRFHALSHIEFSFCGELPEWRGGKGGRGGGPR